MDDGGFGADQTDRAMNCDQVPISSGSAESETHKEDRPYKCNQCDKSYRHAGSLVNHKRTHQVGLYTCLICQKEYSNPMGLKSHLRTHSEEKRFQCEHCGESFRMSQQLYNHRKSLHSFSSLANAEKVSRGRKFEAQSPVLVESNNLMSNLENYIAESMVPVDFSQLALKYYPEEKSQDESNSKEDDEGDGTFTEERDELANSSTEEYRFKCNQCDKAYKHAGSLANHKQSHMVGVYQCAICYKEFSNLMAMKNHCRLHSDSRSRRRLKSPSTSAKNAETDTPQTDAHQTGDFMETHEDPPNISDVSENGDRMEDEEKVPVPGRRRRFELAPKSLSPISKSNPDVTNETFSLDSALQSCSSENMVQRQENKISPDASSNIQHENGQVKAPQLPYDGTHEEDANSGDLGTRPFRCQECGKTYRHAGSLINHKKTHQTGVYNCSLCSKQMFNMAALKNHLRAHFKSRGGRKLEDAYFHSASFSDFFPSPEDPFQCLVCGKILANESDFLQHQLLHQEDGVKKDYTEEQHKEEVSESMCWQEHPQVSHGSSDDSAYSSGPGRTDTIKTEAENLALQQWNDGESLAITQDIKAENTGLELQNSPPNLNQVPQDQINSNKEESCSLQEQSPADRPYKCESCERTYRHKSSLINHKLTHKIGVYQCSLCPKQYTNLMALRNHVRFHSRSHTGRRGLASRRGHHFHRGKPRIVNKTIHSVVESSNFNGETSTSSATHVAASETTLTASPIYCPCGKSFNHSESFQRHSRICKNVPSVSSSESPVDLQRDNSMSTDPRETASETNPLIDPLGKVSEASEPHGRRVYECDLCEKSYRHSGSLINHKRTHQTGDYMCPYCSKHVHNLAALKNHIRIHHKVRKSQLEQEGDHSGTLYSELCFPHDGKDLLGCGSCEETFRSEGDLLAHQMVHMQLEVDPWDPQAPESSTPKVNKVTNKGLGSIDWEQSSISDFHGNRTKDVDSAEEDGEPLDYTCVECGEVYDTLEDLNNHKHTHNTGIFQCSFCPKEYSNLLALKSHFQSHTKPQARRNSGRETSDGCEGNEDGDSQPSMDNSYDCGHCGMIFSNEVDFHQHQVAHEKMVMDESLVPEVRESELSFPMHSSERDLLMRIKSEMEEAHHSESADGGPLLSHICGFCGKTYDDLESLQVHGLSHGAEGESGTSENFKPEADFEGKTDLQQNVTLKEEESPGEMGKSADNLECRPYTCDQCGKTYRHGGSLVNHKKTHLVGNFQCVACFRQYPNLAAFRNHLRHHPDCKQQALLNNPHALHASYLNDNLYPAAADGGCFNFSSPSNVTLSEHSDPNLLPSDFKPNTDSKFKDNSFPVTASPQTDRQTPIRRIKNSNRRFSRRVGRRSKSIGIQASSPGNRTGGFAMSVANVEDKSIQVCEFCGTMFFGVKDLAQHLSGNCERSSQLEKDRSSPLVEDRTGAKEETGLHQRPFRCEVCGRSYRHAGSLINHKQTHKTGVFRCSICQKRFFNLMAMKNHNRIHFELKRHKCLDCGKAFRLQKQLDTHQRIHRQRAAARKPGRRNRRNMRFRKVVPWPQQKSIPSELPTKVRSIEEPNDDIEKNSAPEKVTDPNARPYQCEECGRSYRHAGSLFNHKKSHKTGQYCCSVCGKTYNNLMAMKNHQRTHYKTKRHHCPHCEKTFRWKRQLVRHQLVHVQEEFESGPQLPSQVEEAGGHQEQNFPTSLKSSPAETNDQTSNYEKESYNSSNDFSSVCVACGILFSSYDELESHLCTQNLSDKLASGNEESEDTTVGQEEEGRPYQCNICGRSYRHSGSLRNHKNTHETGLYKCSVCQKKFFNFMAIKNHLRIHTAEKRFQCSDCGKAFLSSRELIGHRRVHTGEKPFHCPTCDRGFSRKLNLRHHQRTAHKQTTSSSSQSSSLVLPADEPLENNNDNSSKASEENQNLDDPNAQERKYKCNQCERSYRHAGSLFNHQKTHRTGVYKCPNCLKEFFNLLAFKDHLRIHKYPCEDCGKTFRIASHLAAHRRIHEQDGPFACSLCHKHFSCRSSFDQHQLTHTRPSSDVLEPKAAAAAAFMVEVT